MRNLLTRVPRAAQSLVASQTTLRGSVARVYRAPTFSELFWDLPDFSGMERMHRGACLPSVLTSALWRGCLHTRGSFNHDLRTGF